MILGLSHIAFGCDDVEAATERLAWFGYRQRFDAPELENHPAKSPFLSRHQAQHHIRALAAEGAMAIELLDHGGLAGQQSSALIPVFRSQAPCPGWKPRPMDSLPLSAEGRAMLNGALGQAPEAFGDPALSMTVLWVPAPDGLSGLHACVVPTASPQALAAMLVQLRFRPDVSNLWSLLTPLPALQARLIPVPSARAEGWAITPFLDAPGCACMALMARDTARALLPAGLQGESVSFTLPVNGVTSRITLARPDTGPIIELVDQTT